ncbi:hypothetical protein JK358_14100 [Nocardia sp. 2]|uniref:DUF8020 domain-containing protein n=1 Tax=Nocardia acididurans TaxID=2802282 RepID=A0ABS1M4E1_9NOCA|nr:hypothetical protein [Nocardia acididurans]MBL1075528.1 hypothetical protein [Nocardia acididurans]
MKFKKFAATALLAVAATAVTAATAQGAPAEEKTDLALLRGTQNGVTFISGLTADSKSVKTVLDTGAFAVRDTGDAVTVSNDQGEPVATVPLTYRLYGQDITLRPTIGREGKELLLQPTDTAPEFVSGLVLQDISTSEERWNAEVQRASFGALIGAGIGLLVTIPFFGLIPPFILGTLAGVAIGAGIGFLVVGGQPLIDAGTAYFTGQP